MKTPDAASRIGEMRLRVPNMSAEDARWIGHEVARRLAALPAPPNARANLTVRVAAPEPGIGRDQVADRIVRGIVGGWK